MTTTTKPKTTAKTTAKTRKAKITKDPRVGSMALWIMTPFGCLYPVPRPPKTVAAGDPATMQVRARRREHLDAFREHFCPALGETLTGQQVAGKALDYPYRAYISPQDLALAVGLMILATDSEKFKPLTSGKYGLKDRKLASDLHSVYNSMWSTQLQLSDGTSSYDGSANWARYGSPKDAKSPAKICQRSGHWFSRKIIDGTYGCSDCPAIRSKGKLISYPDSAGKVQAQS